MVHVYCVFSVYTQKLLLESQWRNELYNDKHVCMLVWVRVGRGRGLNCSEAYKAMANMFIISFAVCVWLLWKVIWTRIESPYLHTILCLEHIEGVFHAYFYITRADKCSRFSFFQQVFPILIVWTRGFKNVRSTQCVRYETH
jgi:hypothetical protein